MSNCNEPFFFFYNSSFSLFLSYTEHTTCTHMIYLRNYVTPHLQYANNIYIRSINRTDLRSIARSSRLNNNKFVRSNYYHMRINC